MPTNFPTGVDNFTNPTANDSLNLPSHSTQHANANDAIEAVEDYLLNGVGKNGLVHINTTTFTAQTAVNFNNVFTSTFRNYRITMNANLSTNSNLSFRYRNGGSDVSTSNYFWHFATSDSGATGYGTAGIGNPASSFLINDTNIAGLLSASFDIFNPAFAIVKTINGMTSYQTAFNHKGGQSFCGTNLPTAFDGFTFFMPTGNFTGNISVYGYRV